MVLKLSLKRFSTEAFSFSSTVSRISSSFLVFSSWRFFTRTSTVFWMFCKLSDNSLRLPLRFSVISFLDSRNSSESFGESLSTSVSMRIIRSSSLLLVSANSAASLVASALDALLVLISKNIISARLITPITIIAICILPPFLYYTISDWVNTLFCRLLY